MTLHGYPLFLHCPSWILNRKQFCIFQGLTAAYHVHAKIQVRCICLIWFTVLNAFLHQKILPLKKKTVIFYCTRQHFLSEGVFCAIVCWLYKVKLWGSRMSSVSSLCLLLQEVCKMRATQHLRAFHRDFGRVNYDFWISCGCMHTVTFVLYAFHYLSDNGAIAI